MLEMADGVEVLLSAKCSGAVEPLLRSMFEAFVSLKFIQGDYRSRSLVWLCTYAHEQIAYGDLFNKETKKGARFREDVSRHLGTLDRYERAFKSYSRVVRSCMELLEHPDLQESNRRFNDWVCKSNRKKKNRRGLPKWYQLCGKSSKSNLSELAESVGLQVVYDFFYPRWSAKVHGVEPNSLLVKLADGKSEFRPLRPEPRWPLLLSFFDYSLSTSIQLMLNKFLTPAFSKIDPQFSPSPKRFRQDGDQIFYTHSDGRELDVTTLLEEDDELVRD
jgi:hypothetical protein